jgi:putative transposase
MNSRSACMNLAREGTRRMLANALEAEVGAYIERHRNERDEQGHALVVRNGRGAAAAGRVAVGSGTMERAAPRVNDRRTDADGNRQRFSSAILPTYIRSAFSASWKSPVDRPRRYKDRLRCSPKVAEVLGRRGCRPVANISRLLSAWVDEYEQFRTRGLRERDYRLC